MAIYSLNGVNYTGIEDALKSLVRVPDGLILQDGTFGKPVSVVYDTALDTDEEAAFDRIIKRKGLQDLTRQQVVDYVRQGLIDADGSPSALNALYTQARAYEQQNAQLTATMQTFRTLHDVANPTATINLTTNQGKAQYMLYFIQSVALWS